MRTMKLIPLFIVAALIAGCATPAKMIENREYDQAIVKMSENLRTGRVSDKNIALLAEAYQAANQRDQDQIMQLRQSGQPDIWSEVYQLYLGLEQRQERIKNLPDQVHQGMDFSAIDYKADINESRARAAAYLYAKGKRKLESDEKDDSRQAYALFQQLAHIDNTYRDLEKLMHEAIFKGADRALLAFENQTNLPLPQGFVDTLMKINSRGLKSHFVKIDAQPIEGQTYDFTIWVKLQHIEVSPEREEQRRFTESRVPGSIRDESGAAGSYNRNHTGKLETDEWIERNKAKTSGRLKRHGGDYGNKPASLATVNEHILRKSAQLEAKMEIVRNADGLSMYSTPIMAKSNFEHKYAFMFGSVEALSDETKELLKNEPIPFPSDAIMVLDAAIALREALIKSLQQETTPLRERAYSTNIDRIKR